MSVKETPKRQAVIRYPDDLRATYSNSTLITHTKDEFFIDFLLLAPPKARIETRIVVSPDHAKRIIDALNHNVANYEKKYGKIDTLEEPPIDVKITGE